MKKDQKTKYLCMYNCTENKRSLYTKPNENGVIIYSIFVHKLVAKKTCFRFSFRVPGEVWPTFSIRATCSSRTNAAT